jgi:hypothetical protein
LKAKRTPISQMLRKSNMSNLLVEKEEKADKFVYDSIDPSSPIESALHFHEGVSYSGIAIPGEKKCR